MQETRRIKSEDIEDLIIKIEKADGEKCQRCWNWDISVGTQEDHPGLCERCQKVIMD